MGNGKRKMTVQLDAVKVASEAPTLRMRPAPLVWGSQPYSLIIFDKDGTLCRNKNGQTFNNHPNEQEMIPGVVEVCHKLFEDGIDLAIASNQGGVAFGYLTFEDMILMVTEAAVAIKAHVIRACPDHPKGSVYPFNRPSTYRKPESGMLTSIMDELSANPDVVLMVGDRDEDLQAAENAGVEFMWAWEFFGWEKPDDDNSNA